MTGDGGQRRSQRPPATDFTPVSSKAVPRRQSLSKRIALGAVTIGLGLMAGAGATMPDGRPTPTGLDVPRWVTLKSSRVRARQGPGLDYRILWEYRAAGLPVQVIAETREWRKVCDPEGSIAWIHRTVASGRRTVFNATAVEVPVHTGRSDESPLRARLSARAIVPLDECESGWCRIRARKLHGWVRAEAVFGTERHPLCDAARPAGQGPDRLPAG
ncbi:MAG: SH3-like domain-containing protein [Brevundimonas sp.]